MAAYIPVPRDLTRVKSKILFNLTKRQLLCFGAGALIGVPSFFLLKADGNTSMASICMILIMMPFFFLGMYERDGCLLYTSDAADDRLCVDLGGRRIIKKKKNR